VRPGPNTAGDPLYAPDPCRANPALTSRRASRDAGSRTSAWTEDRTHASQDVVPPRLARQVNVVWGQLRIAEITRHQVLTIDGIADRGAVTEARCCHAHLHRLSRWSVGRGIIDTSPMVYLTKPGGEVKRKRVLSDSELHLAWSARAENRLADGLGDTTSDPYLCTSGGDRRPAMGGDRQG